MMKKLNKSIRIFFIISFAVAVSVNAEGIRDKKASLNKSAGSPAQTKFNINNVSTYFSNNGDSDLDPASNSGFIFPKGSNRGVFFESGLVWGGKVDNSVRVGGSTYSQGLQGGRITNSGLPTNQLIAENPSENHVRIYRVRRDYKIGILTPEAVDEGVTVDEIYAQYEKDWNEWPAQYGAPYDDVDSNGVYDPTVDIPGVPGADQTIWYVANDLNTSYVSGLYGSPPMGIEMQLTVWGYNRGGALGNMLFRKYQIINKSNKNFEDMYVAMWSDPDLGDANDDYAGCDTTLSLGFIYNGQSADQTYTDGRVPAAGFDFFQGPLIQGEAGDSAIFKNKKVYGKKNMPMTAFFYFINSDAIYSDPPLGEYQGTTEMYNLLQGKIGTSGDLFPIPDEVGGGFTTLPLSGDPNSGTGYIDGILYPPGDRRFGMASGPFTMAAGDTQEVVVAQIAARGSNYMSSVELLKSYDEAAQKAYDNFFKLPSPPNPPKVSVTEMDNSIILNWGKDLKNAELTESQDDQGYKFQGYNIYQLPNAFNFDEAQRIFTFDINDGVKTIVGEEVDPATSATITTVQQTGSDNGISRSVNITNDKFSGKPLVNGNKYYFAVTAYNYNEDPLAVPNNLENTIAVVEVIPQGLNPGYRYEGAYGQNIEVIHNGPSDGIIEAIVEDPKELTGKTYTIFFEEIADTNSALYGSTVWGAFSGNDTLIKRQPQIPYDNSNSSAPVIDGVKVAVKGPSLGFKSVYETDASDAVVDPSVSILTPSLGSTGYILSHRLHVSGSAGRTWDRFEQWGMDDVIIDFSETSLAWDYINETIQVDTSTLQPIRIPYSVYRVKFPSGEKIRLFAGFYDIDGDGTWNMPKDGDEYIWVDVYGPCYESIFAWQGYDANGNEIQYNPANDAQYVEENNLYTSANTTFGDATGEFIYPFLTETFFCMYLTNATPPFGNKIVISTNKANTNADQFTFTAPTSGYDAELAKEDVKKINVYPNPYYAVNPEEINKYERFVTFTHLPRKANIKIFNLAGQLVRSIQKENNSQFAKWDLKNDSGLPAASGMYIAHIDLPEIGKSVIVKLSIIQEQQILDRF
ncbi:MAG: T9SS type A sorting domain-containing protein [Ignavibacteria bacterium]|nr:T9SS type A sorting domain-containing protein [Ignavibacteria bacterium]